MSASAPTSRSRFRPVVAALLVAAGCGPGAPEPAGTRAPVRAPEHARPADALTAEQRAELERLESLGYAAGGAEADDRATGITVHQPARAEAGLNLVVSGHAPEAVLMDMEGRQRHRWSRAFREVWPHREVKRSRPGQRYFRRARVLENGDLLVVFEGLGLVRLDRDSNVLWAHDGAVHHDVDVGPDGRVHVLTRKARIAPEFHAELPILEDFITVLEPDGTPVESISLLECFRNSTHAIELERAKPSGDIFHTNTLERLDGRHARHSPAFAAGNFLISLRHLDLIAIVDPDERRIVWSLRGSWRQQHQPVLLESGNLLLFDNKGAPGASEVLEIEPLSGQVVWSYPETRSTEFYTATCGSCQRLANGNTLITESERGRAFEVTPGGEIVWEYRSPHRTPNDNGDGDGADLIANLFEVVRLAPDFPTGWIE